MLRTWDSWGLSSGKKAKEHEKAWLLTPKSTSDVDYDDVKYDDVGRIDKDGLNKFKSIFFKCKNDLLITETLDSHVVG